MTGGKPAAVELRELTRSFGNVRANAGVNLRVAAGTIHGVVGENGAGKSTAMKILYGMCRPDSGDILIDGEKCVWRSPSAAIARGIGMVHQHFMLAGPYSALDNILLGAEPRRRGAINRQNARARLEELARQYGLPVPWDRPVGELPVGLQQRIEILKLLFRQARILILDEPTAALTPQETNDLFVNLRKLRDEGKTILLITHKLREVMALTDHVSVFRTGKVVAEMPTAQTTPGGLASLMVGRKMALDTQFPTGRVLAEPAIEVAELNLTGVAGGRHRLNGVTFTVRRGEIVGLAGVEGNGQSELLQAILHPREPKCRTSGTVKLLGADVTGWTAARIRNLGVAVIPEDRHHEGLLLDRPVAENFLLGLQRSKAFGRYGFLNLENLRATVARAIETYDIRPGNPAARAGGLSGGNQQKLVVAREFQREPLILIAAQPTRGVDVGAIEFIRQRIIRARDDGVGVLLVSFELEDILALSDRILVMYEGRIAGEFKRGEVTERELGLKMGGS